MSGGPTPQAPGSGLMTSTVTRRGALKIGVVATLSIGGLLASPMLAEHAAAATASTAKRIPVAELPVPRYRFDCVSPVPQFAPLGRLEEVWADARYLTVTDCVTTYVAEDPFVLTPEESAIVDVVTQSGGVVVDRQATYLLILAVSTRIDPANLPQKLAQVGRPIVQASLALAPEAPQSRQFTAWLAATA